MPTTIHPFPELRAYAESEARDIWTRHVRLFREHLPDMEVVADPHDASDGFAVTVAAQVERLCDLTRFASRAVVAALAAERVGLDAWTGAGVHLGRQGWTWALWDGRNGSVVFTENMRGGANRLDRDTRVVVPGIAAITDPAEALTAIVTHLWPSE